VERHPVPFDEFVLKVHSRCDLACDHCYIYESADQSWRDRPVSMPDDVIRRTADRIAEHAAQHSLTTVRVVLHGGEPLLAGHDRLRVIIAGLHTALRGACQLDVRIHTNGVRLDREFCELFAEYRVKVGVSLDSDRRANDRHRRYANGRSSYDQVVRALTLLRTSRFRHLFAGILCTIDVANDPGTVYGALAALGPPRVDFLLPHATWDAPPPRAMGAPSQYGDWLIAIFDRWLADGRPMGIRTFESVLSTLTGGGNLTEALGLAPASLAVIETDGTYEQVDSLKVAFAGAPVTGLNVFEHGLDLVAQHPGIVARQQGRAGLCRTCQDCPVVASCGGGLYAHRYRPDTGFDNPSVYCADLLKLITHIKGRLPEATTERRPLAKHALSDDDFRQLAAGYGSAAGMEQLIGAQRTLRRALLGALYQVASTTPAVPGTMRETVRTAWAVLAVADKEQPEALDTVLAHPYTRVWAARYLQWLRRGQPAGELDPAQQSELFTGLGHFAALAAVIGIRAGVQTEVPVPVTGGALHLPTLGRLVVGTPQHGREPREAFFTTNGNTASIRIGRDCWELTHADLLSGKPLTAVSFSSGEAGWQPVRTLTAAGLTVTLEDTDHYRDCHQWPAADRLTGAEAARWQQCFADAWCEIEREFPAYAPAIAAGLTVLMPMAAAPAGRDVSATARHAFGAIGAALPADATTLALLIMHEFQHVKMGAVLDLYDLYDPADNRLYHAPWREGMRPLEGLLQGTYAHLAVSEYWRTRQQLTLGTVAQAAGERFAFWHGHTRTAIQTLAGSGSMTPLGLRFVEEMRRSAER
jgi:uncharacterized protein